MPVTLISGKNNVGKSTLLEGVFLLFGCLEPRVFFEFNSFRETPVQFSPKFLWEPLFHGLDMSKELSVAAVYNGEERGLRLQKDEKHSVTTFVRRQNDNQESAKPLDSVIDNYPLKLSYHRGDYEESGLYEIAFPNVDLRFKSPPKPITEQAQYIGPGLQGNPNVIAEWFGRLELSGAKKRLIDVLRLMDDRITDLFTIVSGGAAHVYAQLSSGLKIPLRLMGDGMNKLLFIVMSMLAEPNNALLIDEVENGFHHSFHEQVWRVIFGLSAETRCQVFATTHSYECISGAVSSAAENPGGGDLLYVRLGFQDGDIVPHVFPKDLLGYALRSEMEVR
jgi:hypothetical protein